MTGRALGVSVRWSGGRAPLGRSGAPLRALRASLDTAGEAFELIRLEIDTLLVVQPIDGRRLSALEVAQPSPSGTRRPRSRQTRPRIPAVGVKRVYDRGLHPGAV